MSTSLLPPAHARWFSHAHCAGVRFWSLPILLLSASVSSAQSTGSHALALTTRSVSQSTPSTPLLSRDTVVHWQELRSHMGDLRGHLPELIQARMDTARADGRTLFIELGATWCGPCRELEHNLKTSTMIDAFSGASVVHLDVNEWDLETDMAPLGIKGGVMPIVVAVDTTGHAVAQLNGVIDATKIKAFIDAHRWTAHAAGAKTTGAKAIGAKAANKQSSS